MTARSTLIQSVAHSPRSDVTQPAGEAYSSRRTPLAAPFPIPPEASAFEVEQRFREASIAPAFLAAWRETQGQPTDAEPRKS